MMMRMVAFAGLALLAGCATDGETPVAIGAGSGMVCHNDALAGFVGQKATAELGAQMLEASGARTLRWGGPGQAMTMDFRQDRLTVSYDENMVITRASCG